MDPDEISNARKLSRQYYEKYVVPFSHRWHSWSGQDRAGFLLRKKLPHIDKEGGGAARYYIVVGGESWHQFKQRFLKNLIFKKKQTLKLHKWGSASDADICKKQTPEFGLTYGRHY
jgi:hypothetical protein